MEDKEDDEGREEGKDEEEAEGKDDKEEEGTLDWLLFECESCWLGCCVGLFLSFTSHGR